MRSGLAFDSMEGADDVNAISFCDWIQTNLGKSRLRDVA